MLAQRSGATLTLRNHPEGGLEAQVTWPTMARDGALERGHRREKSGPTP
jgi:hypothetical protein